MRIAFGELSIRNTYPFIASIAFVARTLCMNEVKSQNEVSLLLSPLFITAMMFTAESLIGFYHLIHFLTQTNQTETMLENLVTGVSFVRSTVHQLANQREEAQRIEVVLLILIIAFMDGLFVFIDIAIEKLYRNTDYISFQLRCFHIVILFIMAKVFLKSIIHRHQWVSLVIIVFGFFLATILEVIWAQFYLFQVLFLFLNYIVLASRDTTEKWVMERKPMMPIPLLFYQGVVGMLLTWMLIGVSYAIGVSNKDNLFFVDIALTFSSIYSSGKLLYYGGFFIGTIVYNLFYIHTKYYFSPLLVAIGDSFSTITLFTIDIIFSTDEKPHNSSFVIAGYSVIFIGCLIYNEIIILYVCNLEIDTKVEITKRTQKSQAPSVSNTDNSTYNNPLVET